MVIDCPQCHKRYYVESKDIGLNRTVRCTACKKTWTVEGKHNTQKQPLDLQEHSNQPETKDTKGFTRKLNKETEKSLNNRPRTQMLGLTLGLLTFLSLLSLTHTKKILPLLRPLQHFWSTLWQRNQIPSSLQASNLHLYLDKATNRFSLQGTLLNKSHQSHTLKPLKIVLWGHPYQGSNHHSRAKQPPNQAKEGLVMREVITYPLSQNNLKAGESLNFTYTFKQEMPWLKSVSITF